MMETPIFEEIFMRLVRLPNLWVKVLIGGLLSFVPILNIFAFGYLYRFSKKLRSTGQLQLPEWEDWRGLFFDGLRFALVWLLYWLLPIVLAIVLFRALRYQGLASLAYLILTSVTFLSSIFFTSALYRYQMRSDYRDLLDVVLIVRMTYMKFSRFALPAFVFFGMLALALPLYGFALFFGFLILIAYTNLCYSVLEQRNSPSF